MPQLLYCTISGNWKTIYQNDNCHPMQSISNEICDSSTQTHRNLSLSQYCWIGYCLDTQRCQWHHHKKCTLSKMDNCLKPNDTNSRNSETIYQNTRWAPQQLPISTHSDCANTQDTRMLQPHHHKKLKDHLSIRQQALCESNTQTLNPQKILLYLNTIGLAGKPCQLLRYAKMTNCSSS